MSNIKPGDLCIVVNYDGFLNGRTCTVKRHHTICEHCGDRVWWVEFPEPTIWPNPMPWITLIANDGPIEQKYLRKLNGPPIPDDEVADLYKPEKIESDPNFVVPEQNEPVPSIGWNQQLRGQSWIAASLKLLDVIKKYGPL